MTFGYYQKRGTGNMPKCNDCEFKGNSIQCWQHCEKMNHKWSGLDILTDGGKC